MPRIPKRRAECDVRSLPISPAEAFLLSRIDGTVSDAELATLTGLDPSAVGAALDRLVHLGAIELAGAAPSQRPAAERNEIAAAAFASMRAPVVEVAEVPPTREPSLRSALYDPAELDEPCDLDTEQKRKVLDLFYRLDGLDHYGVLSVEPTADKKAIKKAYYALAPDFHPDRFFRKNLGAFKPKMEAIFGRLTLAHDTLTQKDKRAEYDAYLGTTRQNRTMEEALAQATAPITRATSIPRPPMAPAATSATPSTAPPPIAPSTPPPVRIGSVPAPAPSASQPPPSADAERARREALARKLGLGGRSIPAATSTTSQAPPLASTPSAASEAAMQNLVRRRDSLQAAAHRAQVDHYIEAARSAQGRNDLATAANFYRLARALDPNDLELAALQESTAKAAAAALADGYTKQGDYEAHHGRWRDAALSYTKAAAGLPDDPDALLKAANALVKAGGEIRKAVELARRAVALSPKRLEPRLLLAEAYLDAGLTVAAGHELEAARELAPKDARIADLAKRLR